MYRYRQPVFLTSKPWETGLVKRWVAPLVVSLLLAGCTTSANQSSRSTPTTAARVATTTRAPATTKAPTTTRAPATTAPSCTLEDEGRDSIREWNKVSTELLTSYMDMTVTADQYVEDSERIMPKLNRVVRDLRDLRECLPADEAAVFEPIRGTYNDKLSGYSMLENAVRLGSPEMEEAAIQVLSIATAQSVAMVCELARITGEPLPDAVNC